MSLKNVVISQGNDQHNIRQGFLRNYINVLVFKIYILYSRRENMKPMLPNADAKQTNTSQLAINPKKTFLKLNIQSRKQLPNQDQTSTSTISQPVPSSSTEPSTKSVPEAPNSQDTSPQTPQHLVPSHTSTLYESSTTFYKKYKIVEYIDGGTSAVVQKCIKKTNNKQYVVKRTKCQPEQVLDIKNMFSTIKLLDHQNIIKYHSLYISYSQFKCFLVMEYFPFPTLSSHHEFCAPNSPDIRHSWPSISTSQPSSTDITYSKQKQQKLQKIMTQILDAISYMHKIGICHRDIKPENILYDDKECKIKIIDFGVSRDFGGSKIRRQMMTCTGTTEYKAMELFRGGFYDELIDQWAAGITLYKLITGTTPFVSPYPKTTIQNIQNCILDFKQQIWSLYNPFVKDLIRSLVCPREHRITAEQAKNNLWFKNGNKVFWQSLKIAKKSSNDENSRVQSSNIDNVNNKFMQTTFGGGNGFNSNKNEDKIDKKILLKNLSIAYDIEGVTQEVSDYDDDSEEQKKK